MTFRNRVRKLNKRDKEHLKYVVGDRPSTKTNVVSGLREAYALQGKRRCMECVSLQRKLGLEV